MPKKHFQKRDTALNNKYDNLINPDTQERVEASTGASWIWVAFFGPFHHWFNGRISTGFLFLLFCTLTGGLAALYYIIWCRTVARNYYLDKGYVPFSDFEKERKEEERHKQMLEMIAAKN
jgi:hypothetical protein